MVRGATALRHAIIGGRRRGLMRPITAANRRGLLALSRRAPPFYRSDYLDPDARPSRSAPRSGGSSRAGRAPPRSSRRLSAPQRPALLVSVNALTT